MGAAPKGGTPVTFVLLMGMAYEGENVVAVFTSKDAAMQRSRTLDRKPEVSQYGYELALETWKGAKRLDREDLRS